MKILKKNQLALLIISLMLITAGYLNYTATIESSTDEASADVENGVNLASIGEAKLVNANTIEENTVSQESNVLSESVEAENNSDDYFTTSKLERDVMYSQMIERYQEILDSSNVYTDEKAIATEQIDTINETQNAIMITENLLTTKGFENNVIFVNGESVSVIIGKEDLTQDEIAQVQNIVSRELNVDVSNIHISSK